MAEAATSPSRRASIDSAFSDYQVELLKVENSLESALAISNSQEQQRQRVLEDDELFLHEDHPSFALTSVDSTLDGCSAALWKGGLRLVIEAPIARVWEISSDRCGICRWMPMIEECEELDPGDESGMGSRRLIHGDILPRIDNIQSWAIEKLVEFDAENHYYTYVVEESNIGLEGYRATLQLNDFGDNTTLVNWIYEVREMEDTTEEGMADYMGMFFKACIRRLELLASSKERDDNTCHGLIGPAGS